ncbi:MAG: S-layer homology domain-containing protein [Gudongella sp.]|nr:S-layer homology domain-containing protein [Gudongella sp.]
MNKKLLSVLLIFVLMIGQSSFVLAQTDNEKVDWLIERGLVTGDSGGYRLNDPIKRSEVAAMITRTLDAESTANLLKPIQSKFSDVKLAHWANGYINYVASSQFVNGYPDNTFKPDNNITYAEIIKTLVMILNPDFKPLNVPGGFWATPYIIESIELGILKDVKIDNSNYNNLATREKVFEMIYNTISNMVMKDQESYKVIVLENARTGNLDQDEVRVVLMELGTNSPEATIRYKKNEEIDLKLPATVDTETILGMVLDISIDKDDNIKALTVDESFQYYTGPFVAYDTEIMLNDGEKYDVVDKTRYPRATEKLYGVYYNDESMDYMDYVIENDSIDENTDGAFVAEFAKVTVKGDEVYFIDAFTFDDIAPITEVSDSGEELQVRVDYPSASEKSYYLDSAFGYKDGAFISLDLKDILEDTIVHIYNNNAIVKFNTSFAGEFEGVREKDDVYYAKIEGETFQIRSTNSKRPVYSLDGTNYFTLYDINAEELLKDLDDLDVMAILDLNDHLQLLEGEIKYNEKTIVVKDTSTREIYTSDTSVEDETFRIDNFSVVMKNNATNGVLSDFYKGSIAYITYDRNLVEKIVRIAHAQDIIAGAKMVGKNSKGEFYIDLDSNDIRVDDKSYSFDAMTNVFIVNSVSNEVTRVEGLSMAEFLNRAKPGIDLKAYIITDRDFSMLSLGNEIKVGFDDNAIHTIVFTDFQLADKFIEKATLRLTYDYNPLKDDTILGMDTEGKRYQYEVADFAKLSASNARDIVELSLEDDKVIDSKQLINDLSKSYKVIKVNMNEETITVELDNVQTNHFLSPDLVIFGDTTIRANDNINFALNSDGELETVVVLD